MLEIEIRNFQAITHANLQVDGFAALVGRSNIGKSAIIRAVRYALSGMQGTSFVRHSKECRDAKRKACKCFSSVAIRGQGYDILWEKGPSTSKYVVNGQTYTAIPKGFPDFLSEWFKPLEVGSRTILPQVADQFYPVYLLDESGSVVADVLSDVAKLTTINAATQLVDKDRRSLQSTLKVREKDLADMRSEAIRYAGLDLALAQVSDTQKTMEALQAKEKQVEQLHAWQAQHEAVESELLRLQGVLSLSIPEPSLVEKKNQLAWLQASTQKCEVLASDLKALHPINSVPTLQVPSFDTQKIVRLNGFISKCSELVQEVKRYEGVSHIEIKEPSLSTAHVKKLRAYCIEYDAKMDSVKALEAVTSIQVPSSPKWDLSKVQRLRAWEQQAKAFANLDSVEESLAVPLPTKFPDVERVSRLKLMAAEFLRLGRSVKETMAQLEEVTKEIQELDVELSKIDRCPLCNGTFKHSHLKLAV